MKDANDFKMTIEEIFESIEISSIVINELESSKNLLLQY